MVNVYVSGFPRSGTTWLSRLLSGVLDSPLTNLTGEPVSTDFCATGEGDHTVIKTHWMSHEWDGQGKAVFIQRDPRDVAVSAAHYVGVSWERIVDNMCVWSRDEFDKTRHIFHVQGTYYPFVQGWMNRSDAIHTTYEKLHKSGPNELYRIAIQLGVQTKFRVVQAVYDKQRFELHNSKHPHSLWRGRVGNWREYFTPEQGRVITSYLGTLMMEQGYIKELDWWKN